MKVKSSLRAETRYTTATGIAVLMFGMLLLAGLFSFLIWHVYHSERERALLNWQVVLGLVTQERAKAIDGWFDGHFKALTALSDNVSLKLYLAEIVEQHDPAQAEQPESAAPDYLRTLLEFTAGGELGFAPESEPRTTANEAVYPKTAGIALLDKDKKLIASTKFMPPITGALQAFVAKADGIKPRQFLDIFTSNDNDAPRVRMVAFLVPIQAVQGEETAGYALGVSEVGKELFGLLYPENLPYNNADTVLVRKDGAMVEYLSPLSLASGQNQLKLDITTPNLDTAFLIGRGGGFVEKIDYRKKTVLASAVKLSNAPWFVVHTVRSAAALKESNNRVRMLIAVLLLMTMLGLITLFAVWRHASSLRAERSARKYREMATRHANQERLLRLITDNQLSSMFILDEQGMVRFANAVSGRLVDMQPDQMLGKRLEDILGTAQAAHYLEHNQHALETMQPESYLHRRKREDGTTILNIDHIPLAEIPDPNSLEIRAGTLVVENDITVTMKEKERRERTLQNLVKTLTSVMDRCIPFFTNHSERVSRLAGVIAIEMGVARNIVRTVQFAGKLMNLGRIFLDKELFTKGGKLSPNELYQIQESVQVSAKLISSIEFNGPLAETIRQSGEKMDGSGFLGLTQDDIILPARILAVANTFIGMVSNRSFRKGMRPEEALHILMQEAGTRYDRAVVLALGHYLENRSPDRGWLLADSEV